MGRGDYVVHVERSQKTLEEYHVRGAPSFSVANAVTRLEQIPYTGTLLAEESSKS
jgi:hypothetical protein